MGRGDRFMIGLTHRACSGFKSKKGSTNVLKQMALAGLEVLWH